MIFSNQRKRGRCRITALSVLMFCIGLFTSSPSSAQTITSDLQAEQVYDLEAAKELCDELPLHNPEGIWIYPDDDVTVLILRRPSLSSSSMLSYDIRVVETSDVRLRPGDIIGRLTATPERNQFEAEIFTEKKNNVLLKPKTVLAKLTDEGECMILKKSKPLINFRFSFSPTTLLPRMWRIVRLNTSAGASDSNTPAIGMVKVYPSYDGNGSSRRQPRYL